MMKKRLTIGGHVGQTEAFEIWHDFMNDNELQLARDVNRTYLIT